MCLSFSLGSFGNKICFLEFSALFWFSAVWNNLGAHFSIDRWWLCVLLRRWFIWPAWGQGQRVNFTESGSQEGNAVQIDYYLVLLKIGSSRFQTCVNHFFLHFFSYLQMPAIVLFLSSFPPITANQQYVVWSFWCWMSLGSILHFENPHKLQSTGRGCSCHASGCWQLFGCSSWFRMRIQDVAYHESWIISVTVSTLTSDRFGNCQKASLCLVFLMIKTYMHSLFFRWIWQLCTNTILYIVKHVKPISTTMYNCNLWFSY